MPIDNNKTGSINKLPEVTENGILNTGWPNFKTATLATQYSTAKFFAYVMQPVYSDLTKFVDEKVLRNKIPLGGSASVAAKRYVNIFEAVGFSLISLTSFFLEKANFKHTIYDAMAAERGLDPQKISIFSMYKSHNPFIRSLRDRFSLENSLRIPGSLLIGYNLKAGLVALGADFTLERSIFVENNAYDILRNMLYEVQKLKTSGLDDTQRVYNGLQRAVQRTLVDNHRRILPEEKLLANKEVFQRLTQNIIADKFHMNEAIYILGQVANQPGNTAHILAELDKIEQVGLPGLARQKSQLSNGQSKINTVLEQGKRSFVERSASKLNTAPGMV